MENKFLDKSGVELLWKKIKQLTDKKLEEIKSNDNAISIIDKNKISINVSTSENNLLSIKQDGLYAERPVLHKLIFGSDKQYVYDGTQDVVVETYDGTYN